MWSAARSAKISMILCMPERVSGGDAKFQGFCDGWNKWEGQPAMADNFRTDLDQLLPQRRQRPLLHGIGQRQGTHEVAEVTAPASVHRID